MHHNILNILQIFFHLLNILLFFFLKSSSNFLLQCISTILAQEIHAGSLIISISVRIKFNNFLNFLFVNTSNLPLLLETIVQPENNLKQLKLAMHKIIFVVEHLFELLSQESLKAGVKELLKFMLVGDAEKGEYVAIFRQTH
jgi:cellulose synthase/poly-beta-1,6-N-acetylglucosamine synthase-like glycosyltransferase